MAAFARAELSSRHFQAVLSALCRRNFYSEDIDLEDLRENLYGDSDTCGLSKEEALVHIAGLEKVLRRAAKEHWECSTLEEKLGGSEMKEMHRSVFVKFWANERETVHDAMQKKSTWTAHLTQLSWRIDVKSSSKDAGDINEPSAIFELATSAGHSPVRECNFRGESGCNDDSTSSGTRSIGTSGATMRFEMTREQMGGVLSKFSDVQAELDKITNTAVEEAETSGSPSAGPS